MKFLLFKIERLPSSTIRMAAPTMFFKAVEIELICFSGRFVGLSGGEIFHEMMLRLGVKHVCESLLGFLD